MTKVAIITRTKNRPEFLKRAVSSVSHQTYTEFVHVIVNDGGNADEIDTMIANLDALVRQKIQVFHRPESSNAPDTIFNESIDRVESEYFTIHDDDDTWHPEFLERTVDLLDKGATGVVVRADKIVEKIEGSEIKRVKTERYMSDMQAISLYRQCIDNQFTPIATIIRRKAYEEVGKFDDSLPVVGDWEFGIRFMQKYDVEYLDPGFALANYHHRVTKDNSFSKHNHRTYITKVQNKYLRQELSTGKLGVGYIMNSLRYEQDMITTTVKKLLPNFVSNLVRKKVR